VRQSTTKPLAQIATYGLLFLVAFLFLVPLIWMMSVSLKSDAELQKPTFFPQQPQVENYTTIFQSEAFDYPLYARNTLIIVVLSLIGMVLSSSIAAYGFARVPFPGRKLMFGVCLATMMIPFAVLMVPTYMMFKQIGWVGTLRPLWVPAWFGSAFNVFLLRQFFMQIPPELEESAMLDGCSRWGCFWRIVLPLATPALAVVTLFHTLSMWNDLVGPLIYLSHQSEFTLSLGLQFLDSRSGNTPWNQLMAASVLIVLPVLILFLLTQRTFIRGIATTGLKG
jgi:multiple sugar transport system permease protein